MNKIIRCLFLLFLFHACNSSAQVIDGLPGDSTTIRFTNDTIPNFIADTAAIPLWQIGHSRKTFFGVDTVDVTTIMTDTTNPYKKNANNWFTITGLGLYTIIDFWHKYQTDTGHAGGIVEFSLDTGKTWENILGDCNTDGRGERGILTTNTYLKTDTLITGEPSFTGVQNTLQYSRVQFYGGPFVGPPGAGCDFYFPYNFFLRFRFVSDTTTDTLSGWEIDSIKIEHDHYEGLVRNVSRQNDLKVYPNPAYDGVFNFPQLMNEQNYRVEVYNAIGEKVLTVPYKHVVDIGTYPPGLYFYKVSDGTEYYSGQLLRE